MQRLTAYLDGTKENRMTSDHYRYTARRTLNEANFHCLSMYL